MRIFVMAFLLMFSVSLQALTVKTGKKNGEFKTIDIIESAVDCVDCLDWKLLGVCFWLRCSLFECEVDESFRVGHYIPEFVISVYTFQSEWKDTKDMNKNPSGAIARTEASDEHDTNLDFKSVDIFSHPATLIYDRIGSNEYFCESANDIPMLPHYLSSEDPNWKDPSIEQLFPQSFLGLPKFKTGVWAPIIGDGYWAPLYPRCGWGAHPYDAINAAVAAHRAADILTRKLQPHIYLPASGSCENRCWNPAPVSIDDDANRFQLIVPWVDDFHSTFGGSPTWANGINGGRESFMWNLWRYYACCEAKGAYIGKIDFEIDPE